MSKNYIHYTKEEQKRARKTDIKDILYMKGEELKRIGSEYEWNGKDRKVSIRGNLWFDQYEYEGGNTIDFVRRYFDMGYTEALDFILGGNGGTLKICPPIRKRNKPFKLPPKNKNMHRLFAYLVTHRGIDKDVLYFFVNKGLIYESDKYHNTVFVGFDEAGSARHAHKRGTGKESTYKRNVKGSQPEYSFHWNGTDESIYLFEAPIDMLSFISMNKIGWQKHSYAAACSVSDKVLFNILKMKPYIRQIYICMDSDVPGQTAAKRITEKLLKQELKPEILIPTYKDWNEDLLSIKTEGEKCQAL